MNQTRICEIRGVFSGLYAWGEGWSKEKARKWDEYLENYKGVFWTPVRPKCQMGCWNLVSTQGSIYLHPMDFRTVLRSCGGKCDGDTELEQYFGGELKELKKLCSELAEACGGKFTTMIAQTQVVDNDNFVDLLGERS